MSQHISDLSEPTTAPCSSPESGEDEAAQQLLSQAIPFLQQAARQGSGQRYSFQRLAQLYEEIVQTGVYWCSTEELTYGALSAWRTCPSSIGRLPDHQLTVRDLRHLTRGEQIYHALLEQLQLSIQGGTLRSVITIFAPQVPGESGIRIWNPRLLGYAGYVQPDGRVLGDPAHLLLTHQLEQLGWHSSAQTGFDLLPWVIQMPGEPPQLFPVPPELAPEVWLSHPDYPWFAELGLRWHCVPALCHLQLQMGGVTHTAAPFTGWDTGIQPLHGLARYLPLIALYLGLDPRAERTYWHDRTLVELHIALHYSCQHYGIRLLATHTFLQSQREQAWAGRPLDANWSWMVPPLSFSSTPLTPPGASHSPCFLPQEPPWLS